MLGMSGCTRACYSIMAVHNHTIMPNFICGAPTISPQCQPLLPGSQCQFNPPESF
jgi:hypothetical protein